MMSLERVEYYWGMYETSDEVHRDAADGHVHFARDEIPDAVTGSFREEQIADLRGDYGVAGVGEPEQVDVLTYVVDGTETTVRVLNRAIVLFKTDDEVVRRLHRFLGTLKKAKPEK